MGVMYIAVIFHEASQLNEHSTNQSRAYLIARPFARQQALTNSVIGCGAHKYVRNQCPIIIMMRQDEIGQTSQLTFVDDVTENCL